MRKNSGALESVTAAAVALTAMLPAVAAGQTTVTIISSPVLLEPSNATATDRDGYPPTSGAADPEEGAMAAVLVVASPILDPVATIRDIDADAIDDLRVDEAGATAAGATRDLDDLDGLVDGQLSAGTWTIYWNVQKTGFDPTIPGSSVTATYRGDIERFEVELQGTNITPIVSPTFTVTLEQGASVSQNDLRWLETAPTEIRAAIGDTFTIRTKYSHQSAGGLEHQILQSFYNGAAIRLEGVTLFYYD